MRQGVPRKPIHHTCILHVLWTSSLKAKNSMRLFTLLTFFFTIDIFSGLTTVKSVRFLFNQERDRRPVQLSTPKVSSLLSILIRNKDTVYNNVSRLAE